ncbi:MAG: UDP-N-acetylglucosamine 2-epimerase (non-hydrolyzing) [Candidatus Woesearchaeota archaeon]
MDTNNKIKLVTIVGTRPEIIRLSSILNHLKNSDSIVNTLIHTGQNYDPELNEIFFKDLDLDNPEYYLNAAGRSSSETIGKILIEADKILRKINPDALLILGDTNSGLAAISAKKLKIPIFHYEAGNRCFDQRVPEETNRKIIDNVSDINLTYSKIAKDYLIQEGFNPDRVINIGSPMFEVLNSNLIKIKTSNILKKLKLKKNKYFLVSCHREENVDSKRNFNKLVGVLNSLSNMYRLPVIVSLHPRTKKIIMSKSPKLNKLIKLETPFSFTDYNCLQMNSLTVLSDSGTISEESSILNFKAINIRESHERPEAMEEASVVMTGLNLDRIIQSIEVLKNQQIGINRNFNLVADYNKNNISLKVERIIISYLDYINRVVWQKES